MTSFPSTSIKARTAREVYFRELLRQIAVPGADARELEAQRDSDWRGIVVALEYPSRFSEYLPAGVRPFVQLEIGSARVVPASDREIRSWIHDHIVTNGLKDFIDNWPRAISCVQPEVTALEKIECIVKRYSRDPMEPGTFIRHYEDTAQILASYPERSVYRALLKEMQDSRDIRTWPQVDHPAFLPNDSVDWKGLESAWVQIQPLYWGKRIPLADCAVAIRALLTDVAKS